MEALLTKVDALLVGGAMANTFLAARGLGVGKSLCETDKLALARSLMSAAAGSHVDLLLPIDVRTGELGRGRRSLRGRRCGMRAL